MEILKTTKVLVIIVFVFFSIGDVFSQNSSIDVQNAFSKSYSLEEAGDFSGAISALSKVYDEESYDINIRLAWLSYSNGLYTESIAYYKKCITLKPLSIEARFGVTYPAAASNKWDMVIVQYLEVLEIAPNNYTANLSLGQIYYSRQDYENAEKYYNVILNQYPFTYDVVINTAWNYLMLEKLREAKILFQKALYLFPNDTSALKGLELVK